MNNTELWSKVMEDLQPQLTSASFKTFFKTIVVREINDNPPIAYLETPKDFYTNILKRYLHMIEGSFQKVTGLNYRVVIKSSSEYSESNRVFKDKDRPSNVFDLNTSYMKEKIFNPKYTFDNFVVGESNKFANAACKAVAQTPSEVYNPLFLYGGSGLGKTHLMNSIGIHVMDHYPNLRILYVSSETFTNEFIKALNENKSREFKNKYRRADVLLIDDIQFLEGKVGTQEELFHTFNALYEENKQIILSSDRPPNKLEDFDERLRSRFGWNLIAEIQPPDYETRVAILMKKAENMKVAIDDDMYDIICMISERIKDNIRELEGAFTRVVSFSQLLGEPATLSFAKGVLKDVVISGDNITPEKIKSTVCRHYKIKMSDLDSETRKITIAYPRQVAMYLCRTMTDYSLPKIGRLFGNKHYSTVKHACDKIEEEIKMDKNLKEEIEQLKEEIES
ncbi:MAG: chromosomal replication initiator protein DnaA [Eubacterium sp.]|nr:chromosomal replication initiator protein DnaA [Eubacterium sp.]